MTVDVVTSRRSNLHNEMIALLGLDDQYLLDPHDISAISYRPVQREGHAEIRFGRMP